VRQNCQSRAWCHKGTAKVKRCSFFDSQCSLHELLLAAVAGVLGGTQVVEDSLRTQKTEHVKHLFISCLLHAGLDRLAVH